MGLLSRKSDPIAAAQAEIDKLTAQRARLADRLAGAVVAVEAAVRVRHEALTDADPTAAEMAKLNRAAADAAEARSGIDEASRTVQAQLDEATIRLVGLRDTAERQRIAEVEERRAIALDAAADALAAAAIAFAKARAGLVAAVGEHGIHADHVLATDGIPAASIARPCILAAIRAAAPGVLPAADGLGTVLDTDCALVVRRGISGTLRDHVEDLLAGKVPATEMPRPGQAPAPIDPNNAFAAKVQMVSGAFREPFAYLAVGGMMVQGAPGLAEVPAAVLRVAIEMEIAAEPGTPLADQILRAVKGDFGRPDYLKRRPGAPGTRRMFIDTEAGVVDSAPARSAAWPEPDRVERRA